MQESTEIINRILEDSKKEEWRVSNMTSAMEIAEITETFGKELAHKWSNDTSGMVSLDANIGEWIYHLHICPFCPLSYIYLWHWALSMQWAAGQRAFLQYRCLQGSTIAKKIW